MVPRDKFVNKIRSLGYTFKSERKRVRIWRKPGTTHYIAVPKSTNLEEVFVHAALRQAGCQEAEIQDFIRAASA